MVVRPAGVDLSSPRMKALMEAGVTVFISKGYDRATMADIAEKMGVQKGSIYHYVTSKHELLYLICIHPMRRVVDTFRTLVDMELSTNDKIRQGLENHIRVSCEEPGLLILSAASDDNLTTEPAREIRALRREYQQLWKRVLRDGAERGVVRSDLDWNLALNGMFGMLQWMYKWYKPESPYSSEQIYRTFTTLLLDGLRQPPTSKQ